MPDSSDKQTQTPKPTNVVASDGGNEHLGLYEGRLRTIENEMAIMKSAVRHQAEQCRNENLSQEIIKLQREKICLLERNNETMRHEIADLLASLAEAKGVTATLGSK